MMENLTVSHTYTAHNTDTSTHIWEKKKSTSKSTMDSKYAIFPAANDILPFIDLQEGNSSFLPFELL